MASKVARDIMIPIHEYPHVSYRCTLKEAIEIIEDAVLNVSARQSLPRALLIFDDRNNLLGMVRRRDILKGLEPKFLRVMSIPTRKELFDIEVDPNLVDLSTGTISQAMKKQADLPVTEVMNPIKSTVNADDHLAKVIYKLITRDESLLPVMDEGQVIGVLRSVDVFQEVARIILEDED